MPTYRAPLRFPDPDLTNIIKPRSKSAHPSPFPHSTLPSLSPHTTRTMQPTSFSSASHSSKGRAHYQQDRHLTYKASHYPLYAVFDGHGNAATGHIAAQHCVSQLPVALAPTGVLTDTRMSDQTLRNKLVDVVLQLDKSVIDATSRQQVYCGTTLCAVLRRDNQLFCANVGDSRALVVRAHGHKQLSTDHVTTQPQERARVEKAGGWVIGNLLNGYISMTRAIGDDDLKHYRNRTPFPETGRPANTETFDESLFIAEPDVESVSVGRDELVCVIASDGVWGKLSNDKVSDIVRKLIRQGRDAADIAKAIVDKALAKRSKDNTTAIVLFLHDEQYLKEAVSRNGGAKLVDGSSSSDTESPVDILEAPKKFYSRRYGDAGADGKLKDSLFGLKRNRARTGRNRDY